MSQPSGRTVIAALVLLAAFGCNASDSTGTVKESRPPVDSDSGSTRETDDTGSESGGDSDTDDSTAAVLCDHAVPWAEVAAGVEQSCGVHTDGCAECWGAGEDDNGPSYTWQGEDLPPAGTYHSIHMLRYTNSGFGQHNCGIQADGSATCFGENAYGELDLPPGDYLDIAATAYLTLGVLADGTVTLAPFAEDVAPVGAFTRVEADDDYTLLLGTDGSLSEYYRLTELVDYRTGPYVAMSRKSDPPGTCAVTAEGAVECWLDDGRSDAIWNNFVALVPTAGMVDVCFAPLDLAACALGADGHIECWANSPSAWLVADAPTDTNFVQLTCGLAHACALTTEGDIRCWGYDIYGETIPPT